jgi:hypothetical protein
MPDYNDNHSKLRSSLFGGKPVKAQPEVTAQPEHEPADSGLPDASAPYQAHARPANKPVYTLHCCLGKDGYRSFQYVHLDSDSSFQTTSAGHAITLRFAGTKVVQVTIKGRNLRGLYDHLHQHRTSWVMRADRDLAEEQEAIITAIEIATVESPDGSVQPR